MVYYVLAALASIEFVIFLRQKRVYPFKEVISSLFTSTVNSSLFSFAVSLIFYQFYFQIYQHRLINIELNPTAYFILTFLVVDFGFYWIHRACHNIRFAWTCHEVHHYPNTISILNATSQSIVGMFFNVHIAVFIIFAALGFHPEVFLQCYVLNLLYQLWLHNEIVPRLPWIEGILNTPHLHRIHHSLSKNSQGKNYGGVFILFDRMFGTYFDEKDFKDAVYGTIPPFHATSPISTWQREFRSWKDFISQLLQKKTFKEKLRFFIFTTDDKS